MGKCKDKIILVIQYKKRNWGGNWGEVYKPPKIELFSAHGMIDDPFISVCYKINDFATYYDVIPNPCYEPLPEPDYKTHARFFATHSFEEIIKKLNEGIPPE